MISSYARYNDVHTSGTLYAHSRIMHKSKIFGFFEILLKNPFLQVCLMRVHTWGAHHLKFFGTNLTNILKSSLKSRDLNYTIL